MRRPILPLLSAYFLLVFVAAARETSDQSFHRYQGDWLGVERMRAKGQCAFTPNKSEVRYHIQIAADGHFAATKYKPSGEQETSASLRGGISPNGDVKFTHDITGMCNGVSQEMSYPGFGTLTQTRDGPTLKLISQEDRCLGVCVFRVERTLRRVSAVPGS